MVVVRADEDGAVSALALPVDADVGTSDSERDEALAPMLQAPAVSIEYALPNEADPLQAQRLGLERAEAGRTSPPCRLGGSRRARCTRPCRWRPAGAQDSKGVTHGPVTRWKKGRQERNVRGLRRSPVGLRGLPLTSALGFERRSRIRVPQPGPHHRRAREQRRDAPAGTSTSQVTLPEAVTGGRTSSGSPETCPSRPRASVLTPAAPPGDGERLPHLRSRKDCALERLQRLLFFFFS